MIVSSPRQLKDWINNLAKKDNLVANTVLQNFMMERLLERICVSKYRDNFILKGGFLIAAMVGIDMRSTMDMDTTIKGIAVNRSEIEKILNEILSKSRSLTNNNSGQSFYVEEFFCCKSFCLYSLGVIP